MLQKYYLTDGSRYIKKTGNKYVTVGSAVMADQYTLRAAQKILTNNLHRNWRKLFYIEGVDNFKRYSGDEEELNIKEDDSLLADINKIATTIISVDFPNAAKLAKWKDELEDKMSYYDQALADVDHWIMNHKPPAHIRTKVYGVQHEIEVKRRDIKENLGFVNAMVEAEQRNYTYSKLTSEMKGRKYQPYTPNTEVYGKLDMLLGK